MRPRRAKPAPRRATPQPRTTSTKKRRGDEDAPRAEKAPRPPPWVKALRLDDDARALLATTIAELASVRDDAARGRGRLVDAYADALAAQSFDEAAVDRAVERRAADEAKATKRRVAALKRVHRALDADQRALLSVLVRAGLLPL